jgi:hypothetical protein
MPPTLWRAPLAASAALAAAALTSLGLLWVASRWTRLVFRWSRSQGALSRFARWFDHPRWVRRYWPALAVAVTAVVLPWLAAVFLPLGPTRVVAIETTFLLMIGVVVFALSGVVAVQIGARGLSPARRVLFAGLGLFHAGLQLSTPTLIALMGLSNPWIISLALGMITALMYVARRGVDRPRRHVNLALWLASGASAIGIPIALGRSGSLPLFGFSLAIGIPVAAVLGVFLSAIWLGWYLTVSIGYAGHNNEAGAAARVDEFRQFIRFQVTPDRLIGHVIGVGRPSVVNHRVVVPTWLIDRFAVGPAAESALDQPRGERP